MCVCVHKKNNIKSEKERYVKVSKRIHGLLCEWLIIASIYITSSPPIYVLNIYNTYIINTPPPLFFFIF